MDTYKELLTLNKYRAAAHRPAFDSFDAYVAIHPEGERWRAWITQDGKTGLVIVPCYSDSCGLPGDYNWAYMAREWRKVRNKPEPTGLWFVHVNDCDDSGANKRGLTEDEARQELRNLAELAPFYISELRDFGYETY